MGQKILNWLVIALALAAAGLYGYYKYGPTTRVVVTADGERLTYYRKWQDFLSKGSLIGSKDAPVQIIEIADFECTPCIALYPTLRRLRTVYPKEVAVTFVQQPSDSSPLAEPTARAAGCAEAQGDFVGMHDLLFQQTRDIGVKPWPRMAMEANLPNIPLFEECLKDHATPARVADARALLGKIDLKGNPTLIVNGRKLSRLPSFEELEQLIEATLAEEKERRSAWWRFWLSKPLNT